MEVKVDKSVIGEFWEGGRRELKLLRRNVRYPKLSILKRRFHLTGRSSNYMNNLTTDRSPEGGENGGPGTRFTIHIKTCFLRTDVYLGFC